MTRLNNVEVISIVTLLDDEVIFEQRDSLKAINKLKLLKAVQLVEQLYLVEEFSLARPLLNTGRHDERLEDVTFQRVHFTVVDCLDGGRAFVIVEQCELTEPRARAHVLRHELLVGKIGVVRRRTLLIHRDLNVSLDQNEVELADVTIFDESVLLEVRLGSHGARQLGQLRFRQVLREEV